MPWSLTVAVQQQTTTVDRRIAGIAGRAWGIVTRGELVAARATPEEIRQRLNRFSLVKVFPGVYHVGHGALTIEARYMAAVKACGETSTLFGAAAGHHLGLTRGVPPPPEVAAPTKRRIKGIKTSRHEIHRSEHWTHRRIPCTTPARTLLDLAATLDPDPLSRAVHESTVRYRTTADQIEAVLIRHPKAPGVAKLRRIVRGEDPIILSQLERSFINLLKQHGLPRPTTNRPEGSHSVDCRWPEHKLTVELDSYAFHNTRHSWEQDHHREREAYAREDQFRRYTYGDVCEDPRQMLVELSELLAEPYFQAA